MTITIIMMMMMRIIIISTSTKRFGDLTNLLVSRFSCSFVRYVHYDVLKTTSLIFVKFSTYVQHPISLVTFERSGNCFSPYVCRYTLTADHISCVKRVTRKFS